MYFAAKIYFQGNCVMSFWVPLLATESTNDSIVFTVVPQTDEIQRLFMQLANRVVHFIIHFILLYIRNMLSIRQQYMMNIKILLIFSLVVFCSLGYSILPNETDPILTTFNYMLHKFNFSNSVQIGSCLKEITLQQRLLIYQEILNIGKNAGSTILPQFPKLILKKLAKKIDLSTINCFQSMNDLKLLLRSYNTSIDTFSEHFHSFCTLNFLDVHFYFTNMSQLFYSMSTGLEIFEVKTNKYEQMAELTHKLFLQMFNDGNMRVDDDPWVLSASNIEKMGQYYGISVSNGIIGTVSSKRPFSLSSTVLAGTYDKQGRGRVNNLLQTFSALDIEFNFNNWQNYNNFQQHLNMKKGSMDSSFSSESCSVSYQYYALKNLPHVFLTQFQLSPHQDGQLTVKTKHSAPTNLMNIQKNFQQIDSSRRLYQILETEASTKSQELKLTAATSFLHIDGDQMVSIIHEDWDINVHLLKMKRTLKKGETFKFGIITSLMSSEHHHDPMNQAIRQVIRGVTIEEDLIVRHQQRWKNLWESDIIIEGNAEDQKFIRSLVYHCYSFVSEGKSYGISPMGLSGLGYNGHVFWDMDIWIYPALLILKPNLAKNMIEYRIERLQAAKDNAFINGYRGAMYPWQSSKLGIQETPVWAMTGPLEHHISGCVAFSIWNYYQVTQDLNWLKVKGYDVLYSIAQFFQSRVEKDQQGFYHITHVVGSDEWAQDVNDDAFTNAVAKVSLQIANKASKLLNIPINKQWQVIAEKILIYKFANGTTKEHETYNGEAIKQADANLLSFPLKLYSNESLIKQDLTYYENKIPDQGTPAMTYSIFALLYSRLKDPENSYKFFTESYKQFVKPPFNVFAETKGGTNPYFMTGAGGVLQSVIYGYGGVDITDKGIITVQTSIPKQWRSIKIVRGYDKAQR